MKRLLLAFLILWIVLLVFPGLRERAEPRTTAVKGWVWERMEGPVSPIRDRYRRAQAKSDLDKAYRAMVIQRNQGRSLPAQDGLRVFLARNEIVDDGLDPWGTPYLLVQEPDSLAIVSAGPDLAYHTDDDIVKRVSYTRRPPRRSSR